MNPPTLPGHGYIRGFDGIRAIAVAMVICIHLGTFGGRWGGYAYYTDGVAIFFVLSGFLITGILVAEERHRLFRFYARRILRLYPALILYIGAVVVAGIEGWASVPAAAAVTGITYTSNMAPFTSSSRITSHLWSLAVEEQFYLVWPFLVFWARRLGALLAVGAIGVAWWLRVYPPNDPTRYVDRYFIPAADSILMGCLAALIVCPRYRSPRVQRFLAAPELLFAAVAMFLAPRWAILGFGGRQEAFALLYIQRLGVVAFVMWTCGNQTSRVVALLEWRPLRYMGRISYGIYLWQGFFVRNGSDDPAGWFQRFPYNVPCAIVAAVVSYELVERHVLKLKGRSAERRDDQDAATAGATTAGVRPVEARPATAATAAVDAAVAA